MKKPKVGPIKVITHGTRGSCAVSGPDHVKAGGNTTCISVLSDCLPEGMALIVDMGTGYLPATKLALASGATHFMHFMTHYHHDHTEGGLIAVSTFNRKIKKTIWGPVEKNVGPERMLKEMMVPPYHPVHSNNVTSAFDFKSLTDPSAFVVLFHSECGGPLLLPLDKFEKAEAGSGTVKFGKNCVAKISECLVVRMLYSYHPERTVSYRFEERSTGKVFVFLTDHENLSELPGPLARHLNDADLLIMDCQYDAAKYAAYTKGFGHGTPEYCVETACRVGAKQLGLTHHDPNATDGYLFGTILADALTEHQNRCQVGEAGLLPLKTIFLCVDHLVIEV